MRYSEFNEEYDEDKIRSLLKEYFHIKGDISFENGLVDIDGNIKLVKKCKKLLVKFDKISNNFDCSHNQLTSLTGSPSHVGDNFYCSHNQLTSLIGSPTHIGGVFNCSGNPLTSLEGIPDDINGYIYITWNKDLPLLRLLKYKKVFLYENDDVEIIIKKYCKLGFSRANLIQCQRELIDAGYESNARW